jgi:hypothetical protein
MKIMTLDEKVFEGADSAEICRGLWHSMLFPDESFELWMKNNARRAFMWNNSEVRCTNADEHLADLIAGNIVKVVGE